VLLPSRPNVKCKNRKNIIDKSARVTRIRLLRRRRVSGRRVNVALLARRHIKAMESPLPGPVMERRSSSTIRTDGAFPFVLRHVPAGELRILSGLILCKSRAEASVRRLHPAARRVVSSRPMQIHGGHNDDLLRRSLPPSSKRAHLSARSRYLLSEKSDTAREIKAGRWAWILQNVPGIALPYISPN